MRKIIAILLLSCFIVSCTVRQKDEKTITVGKDTFDLVQTKATVSECELITPVSIHDEVNPRYRIVTIDSLVFKSPKEFSAGDTIDVRVYKRRK